jgi:nucleotide-binding universal stress UspA family protein
VVARLLDSPLEIKRILVPVESINTIGLRPVQIAQTLVGKETEITLLHACPTQTSKKRKEMIHKQLEAVAERFFSGVAVDVRVTAQNNFVGAILNASRHYQLVILRSQRQRVGVNSLTLGATTEPLLNNLNCSVILLGES